MEIHNVIINFPKWVIQPNYTWEAETILEEEVSKMPSFFFKPNAEWRGGAASTVGGGLPKQLATRRAGSSELAEQQQQRHNGQTQENIFSPLISPFDSSFPCLVINRPYLGETEQKRACK